MAHPYRSKDGLLSSSDPEAVARWDAMTEAQEQAGLGLTQQLRAIGVKCAHPDDGWVHEPGRGYTPNNPRKWLSPSYPLFDDGPKVGDLIALGFHYNWPERPYRIVRVTEVEVGMFGYPRYYYDDNGETYPPAPPKKRLRDRLRITK